MPHTTTDAQEDIASRAESVNVRYAESIRSYFDYINGYLNAYRPHGREEQLRKIIMPVIWDAVDEFVRDLFYLLPDRYRRWVRPIWRDFVRWLLFCLWVYDWNIEQATTVALANSGASIRTAELVTYFLARYGEVRWMWDIYSYLRRLGQTYRTYVPQWYRRRLPDLERVKLLMSRKYAFEQCVRRCVFVLEIIKEEVEMGYVGRGGRRRHRPRNWLFLSGLTLDQLETMTPQDMVRHCAEICRQLVE